MSALTQSATRSEKDSIGPKEIPAHVYYGIQTARAVENYPISGMRAHPTLIRAFGMVKEAAAEANRALGLVDEKIANAIIQAAQEVEQGKWNKEFVVDVFQAGAGVSFHMNTNEVIANRAAGGRQRDHDVHHAVLVHVDRADHVELDDVAPQLGIDDALERLEDGVLRRHAFH